MFTSDYEEMCEKANEIQKLFKFRMGDWFIHTDYLKDPHHIVLDENIISSSVIGTYKKDGVVWLPTLEQLFDIWSRLCNENHKVHPNHLAGDHLPTHFIRRIHEELKKKNWFDKKLCLEIIMKDFYHKVWSGGRWMKVE